MRTSRNAIVVVLLVATGFMGGCGSGEIKSDSGVPGVPGRVQEQERSPFIATLLAIFPGFLVHGIGNLYAGNTDKCEDLLAEEGLGVISMGVCAGLTYLAVQDNRHADHSHGFEKGLTRFEEGTEYLGAGVTGVIGVGAFFHSWIKDIVEAGDSAEAHNRDVRRQYDELIHPAQPDRSVPPPAGAPSKVVESAKPTSHRPDDSTVPADPAVAPIGSQGAVAPTPGNH